MRGLPSRATDGSVVDETYTYDKNANVESIIDQVISGTASRSMTYDGLNRLKTTVAPNLWGTATYGYDSLDNLTSTLITGGQNARSTVHNIDYTTNRLSSITNGPANFNFSFFYDSQGNITNRGAQVYQFDLANRMTAAQGRATYVYDGLGRRVSVVGTDGVNRIQVYSQAGQLLYVAPSGSSGTKYIYLHNHQIAEVK
jgi:YD repeat-containing protein